MNVSLLPPIPTSFRAATALPPLIKLDPRADVLLRTHSPSEAASPQPPRRSKIWELAETLHCSIIGTCLSNAELRQTLARLGVKGIEAADAHELHVVGVMLAGRRDAGAKLLQKALDRRHAAAKALVERTGARFLHHDGGIEHSSSLLPGLISRADVLLFPIACISHDAVATLKRVCRQLEKPYLPLRTASLATLASSLAAMARNPTA
jgi:hypothetical protein